MILISLDLAIIIFPFMYLNLYPLEIVWRIILISFLIWFKLLSLIPNIIKGYKTMVI